jgi:hypothetical protein
VPIFRRSFQSSDTLDAADCAALIEINEAFARKREKLLNNTTGWVKSDMEIDIVIILSKHTSSIYTAF